MACKKSSTRKRRMCASARHNRYGKPKKRQPRGRRSSGSHRLNPEEPRRRTERPRGSGGSSRRRNRSSGGKTELVMEKRTGIYCSECGKKLPAIGAQCDAKLRWGGACHGRGQEKTYEVEVRAPKQR